MGHQRTNKPEDGILDLLQRWHDQGQTISRDMDRRLGFSATDAIIGSIGGVGKVGIRPINILGLPDRGEYIAGKLAEIQNRYAFEMKLSRGEGNQYSAMYRKMMDQPEIFADDFFKKIHIEVPGFSRLITGYYDAKERAIYELDIPEGDSIGTAGIIKLLRGFVAEMKDRGWPVESIEGERVTGTRGANRIRLDNAGKSPIGSVKIK